MGVPAAIIGSAIIGSGLGFLGAKKRAKAEQQAAQSSADASRYATDIANQQWMTNRADLAPWRTAGGGAVNQLAALMQPGGALYNTNFTAQDFQNNLDPGYQWRLNQGLDAIQKSAAARGGFFSGQTGIDLNNYAQGAASNEFANAYDRYMHSKDTLYNRLAGLSGTGQTATTTTADLGAANAANTGRNAMFASNALGEGQVGAANAYAGMYGNINNQMMGGLGTYLNYNQGQNYLNLMQENMNRPTMTPYPRGGGGWDTGGAY